MRFWLNMTDESKKQWEVRDYGWHQVQAESAAAAAEDFARFCSGVFPLHLVVQVEGEAKPRRFRVEKKFQAEEQP